MRRKEKKFEILENVSIIDAGSEGKCIARVDDVVIFVEQVVPGDVVDLQITRKKSNYREAKPIKFHHYSEKRIKPVCEHFGVCGGCKWQNLNYPDQLFYKQKQVTDNLRRLGKIELPEVLPILPSAKTEFYRNKLEFTFSNKRWLTEEEIKTGQNFDNKNALGFHIPKMFDKIIAIEKCHLQGSLSNEIRNEVRNFSLKNDLSFFDIRNQQGLLRNLIIRTTAKGELMVIVVFHYEDKEKNELLLNHLAEQFPQITSLLYVINTKKNDSIFDLEVQTFKGRDHILEEIEGLNFKISAKSFFQTNSEQAYELYKITRNFADIKAHEIVYDLYTGTGTIANFVAGQAKKVIGVEYIREAIEDAKLNSTLNNISNTAFFAGDIKDILNHEFVALHGHPHVIITDPPRAGMHAEVVEKIMEIAPEKIVYVSCNAATQARDLSMMDHKYKVEKIQPVDMFPHTHHVENVVLLKKRIEPRKNEAGTDDTDHADLH